MNKDVVSKLVLLMDWDIDEVVQSVKDKQVQVDELSELIDAYVEKCLGQCILHLANDVQNGTSLLDHGFLLLAGASPERKPHRSDVFFDERTVRQRECGILSPVCLIIPWGQLGWNS